MAKLVIAGVGFKGHALMCIIAEEYGYRASIRIIESGTYSIELNESNSANRANNMKMHNEYLSLGFDSRINNEGVNSGTAFHTMY